MAKIRINKLALELNVQNDQVIDALQKKGIPVKNYMSSIDDKAAAYVRDMFSDSSSDSKKTVKAKATVKAKGKTKPKNVIKVKVKAKAAKKKTDAVEEAPAPKSPEPEEKPKTVAKTPAGKEKTPEKSEEKQSKAKRPQSKPPFKKKTAPSSSDDADQAAKNARKNTLKIVKAEDKPKPAPKPVAKKTPPPKQQAPKQEPSISSRAARRKSAAAAAAAAAPEPAAKTPETGGEGFEIVQLAENMPVRELAEKLKCTVNDVIKELMLFGIMSTINQSLDFEVAAKVADKLGFEVEKSEKKSDLDFEEEEQDLEKDRLPRGAIVTIMGHVDHGKTSLLDSIRKTKITESEAGGITQHIGAYQVKLENSSVTFLDTPGHEAFTAMRARGAQVTDIVVLVVAADDGIKPQTKEAIDHANAAGVPIVVAINKIDKPDANPEEVKKQLANLGLLPEDWGGQTIYAEVSALQKIGIDHLLEVITLQAEIMELKANAKLRAKGIVIESKLDKGRGPVATLIVQSGTLKIGDPYIVGPYFGKVRSLINDKGHKIKQAGPSTPVEVIGLPATPEPGEKFIVVNDEKKARQLSTQRIQEKRETQLAKSSRVTMEDLHQQIAEGTIKQLNLIIKADVQGSIHAVQEALSKLESEQIKIKIIHDGVGGITESDVLLATASNAIIIGFSVRPTEKATLLAAKDEVDIRMYSIIYDAINDMQQAMEGMLAPKFRENIMGRAEVRQVFTIPKVGSIAGCQVLSGKVERNIKARLIRDDVVIYEGKILSVRRFKEDVKEVQSGYECGLSLEKYSDVKQGDIVEPYTLEEITA
ncbi:MAG: translation initiation factor IF-2 [Candidatus Nitrohelix vancouverensis]|uniref:Translation initiation factor IF-2 n=1 Tax=Candidatus Nitrohelix vancouverensis TaxID=2705534 RepID=A0A7T0C4L4_9BACT|nr:MAG: translation initiation factor IF-2 [Candidatus Nitrohelix vancouverensis]